MRFPWAGRLYDEVDQVETEHEELHRGRIGGSERLSAQHNLGKHFLSAQGYELTESIFHQDNQSSIRLENNGRASAGQKSRHINIRFFFIKDRIANDDMRVVYYPTECMLADFFTKPLQSTLFKKFRLVILGYKPVRSLEHYNALVADEERVGEEHPNDMDTTKERIRMVNRDEDPDTSEQQPWTLVSRHRPRVSFDMQDTVQNVLLWSQPEKGPIKRTNKKPMEKKNIGPSSNHAYFEK
jgi:hypothetical protein